MGWETPIRLLLANAMAEEGKPLGRLVADLQREFGPHYYGRRDLHVPEEMKRSAIQRAGAESTQSLGRYRAEKKKNLDDIKFFLDAPMNRQSSRKKRRSRVGNVVAAACVCGGLVPCSW